MANFLWLATELWLLSGLIFTLHYYSGRIGFAPLLLTLGGITFLIQGRYGVYIEPFPDLTMFISSNVLVPVVLVTVLVLYIADGAIAARMAIMGVVGISMFALCMTLAYRFHLSLETGGTITGLERDVLIPPLNIRQTIATLAAFVSDMFVIAVFYQGLRNYVPNLSEWIVIGLSLLAGLWTDALVYNTVSDLGSPDFFEYLPGDVVGKLISASLLWLPTAYYLIQIAPQSPDHIGAKDRPLFDLFLGAMPEIKQALLRTEAALHESENLRKKEEAYFRQINDNIHEALWLSEPYRNHAFYVNPAYERLWGRSAPSLYADPLSFVNSLHPADKDRILATLYQQIIGNYDVEYRIIRPDGTIRWVRDRAFPIYNDQGTVYRVAGISEDITEKKEMEKNQLDLAVEREKVKLLRDFVGEATHDLKTPLTAINLKLDVLAKLIEGDRPRKHLEELKAMTARIGHMVEDMLTLSRLENITEISPAEIDLNELIQEVIPTIRPLVADKSIGLTITLCEQPTILAGDRDDLYRALANLIENAIYYTPSAGQISLETHTTATEIICRITDTGIGIKPADLTRIFERFFRAESARQISPAGTGLGLVIVKKIIEQHGGRIEVQSEVGSGTTFSLYFNPRHFLT